MKQILIVDDNPSNLTVVKDILKPSYKVASAASGKMALQFLEKNVPDLVLLDVLMPEMDGFEVLNRIKEMDRVKDIPVIFMTADNSPDMEARCLEAGAVDYIAKPFATRVILSRIERTLEMEELRKNLSERLDQKDKEISEIRYQSQRDALTGVWNRIHAQNHIESRLRETGVGTVFMMDLDNFKAINDNYGHKAGDETLQLFAETVTDLVNKDDLVCRLGGDEFLVFLDGNNDKVEVASLAAGMIESICNAFEESKFETNASVSIGIAQAPIDGDDFDSLYKAADKALYYVKQNGKNDFHFFSDKNELEHRRSGSQIDLDYLREALTRIDGGKGTYLVDYDKFYLIYNFVRRIVERDRQEVQTVLFTLQIDDDNSVNEKAMEEAIDQLESAVYNSLRRVDVSTRYSTRQLIVILMDANTENGRKIADRILENYYKMQENSIRVEYDILEMKGKFVNNRA